jgi:Rrf2 family transcriptional regulator, iron-sulfur cluster assembly transcription factor
MRITQEGDYALRVLLYLYKHGIGKRVEAKVISESENVPLRFLLKLLRKLAGAGIVNSYRGTGGGYAIEKPPSQVTMRQVIEAIEGPIYVNKCLLDEQSCSVNRAKTCEVHRALQKFQDKLLTEMDDLSFEQILKNTAE